MIKRAFLLPLVFASSPSLAEGEPPVGRALQDLLRAHQAQVFECVRASGRADGEVLVRVFVGERGVAERPEILKDQSGAPAIGRCLVDKIKGWDLTPLGAAPGDQVVFPLAFKPPPPVIHEHDVAPLTIAGGRGRARLFLDGRDAPVALDTLVAERGTKIPPHKHEGSDEILYVLSGRGTTLIGGERFALAAGDCVHIPKGVEHALEVEEKLTAVQVYAPAGPEQRFKPPNPGAVAK